MASILECIFDLIAPRTCYICGRRLHTSEHVICTSCNIHLPRTYYWQDPYENEMTKLFWAKIPIERAAALFYYQGHAPASQIIYNLKYDNHPTIGYHMGIMTALEFSKNHFFDDIDCIIPVPLSWSRKLKRGYNQSNEIAKGIQEVTGIRVEEHIVKRTKFKSSQTHKGRWGREENVRGLFKLTHPEKVRGKHILLIDDICTTGATMVSCGKEITKAGNVKISILTLGYSKG
ncbi:ComF family protein [Segatella bryantii]|uniref:ComF family protein n=1 Tax=Segatella bryantii TaxID=77095 RepID=UPI0024318EAD|nr:phosphoribosyltransferase family protein [Segatella bryantii]